MTETDPAAAPPPGDPPPPPPAEPPIHRVHRRSHRPLPPVSRWRTAAAVGLSVLGGLIVVVVIAGFLIHLPYRIISPGEATPLDSTVVTISGAPTYQSPNNVLFLTVRVTNEDPTLWRVVTAWLDPDQDIEERNDVVGCASPEDNVTYNTLLMQQSQGDAKDVALTRLGYTVTADAPRVTIVQACAGVPAYGIVKVGDQVLAVDDQAVASSTELVSLVRGHAPGDTVRMSVNRDGAEETLQIVAGRISADGTKCTTVAPGASGQAGRSLHRLGLTGVRHLPLPDRRDDQHRPRRRSVGGACVHPRDHRRPHAGRADGRQAGRGDRDDRDRRLGRTGRRCRAEGDHGAAQRCAAHARAEGRGCRRAQRRGWDEGGRCRDRRRCARGTATCRWIASASNCDDCGAIMTG